MGGGGDAASVLFRQTLGDGQAQTVAPGLVDPGSIHPVKAVEQVGQRLLRDLLPGIGHPQLQLRSRLPAAMCRSLPQGDPDRPPFRGMLHRVVDEDRRQLLQLLPVPQHIQRIGRIRLQIYAPLEGHALKGQRRGHHRLRCVEPLPGLRSAAIPGLVQVGELQQLVHQFGHPSRLLLDIIQPFVPAHGLLQDGGVRVDDRQRRLQLMTRIGCKALLHLHVLLHRPDDGPGQEPGQQHEQAAGGGESRQGEQDRLPNLPSQRGGVQQDDPRSLLPGNGPIDPSLGAAFPIGIRQSGCGDGSQGLSFHLLRAADPDNRRAILRQQHRPQFILGNGADQLGLVPSSAAELFPLTSGADLRIQQHPAGIQDRFLLGRHLRQLQNVDRQEDRQQHPRRAEEDAPEDLPTQTADHSSASSS